MELNLNQQIKELTNKASDILIALPCQPSSDAIAAALSLYLALEKMGKRARVVCSQFELPASHSFLPKSKEIHSELSSLRKFIVSLDLSKTKVKELSYDIAGDKLNIFITPKNGFFNEEDLSTSAGAFEYDLIYILDSPDYESLGPLYKNNVEFFYQTPVINIDHHPTNENFGQINLVELTATSVSEIIFELIREFGKGIMDEYIATGLLTGIISKTKSFQSPSVTPRSLAVASHLIDSGARREEIIKNLYQTKSITALRLWGRALARLKTSFNNRLVWSVLALEDFSKSGAETKDLEGVIDELIINSPQSEIIAILYEKKGGGVCGLINVPSQLNALLLFKDFNPVGSQDFVKMSFGNKNLIEAEKLLLEVVGKFLG